MSAPYLTLPGRNRSTEYNALPGRLAAMLMDEPVVFVKDDAGFVDPDELARDVREKVVTRLMVEASEARREGNERWAAAITQVAKDADRHLDVEVTSVRSPRTGSPGWKVTSRPLVSTLLQRAEYMARGMG
jgi:hypothetical protein